MTGDYQTDRRMGLKVAAIPLPDFKGKTVLDVGTDHGYFAFLASDRGAADVLGLDRNRTVRGGGVETDLIEINRRAAPGTKGRFERVNIGKQWHEFGRFDVVLVFSVYHHLFENCGDHSAVWFWLRRHCNDDAELIFEGPLNDSDPVVRANVSDENRISFTMNDILGAARVHFDEEYIGPALHEPTRYVYRFRPKPKAEWTQDAHIYAGAGGATKAFEYADGRRIKEIESILGVRPIAGSLNLHTYAKSFGWDMGYYRAQVMDVKDRSAGIGSEWAPRWARLYPINIEGIQAWAFRFEGEKYPETLVELLAPTRLRDHLSEMDVMLTR
jgi:hypothetical protein